MDKESRAARRAFEQRIQKHKIIQEKCEDDFQKLQSELDLKVQELARKEENAVAKRDVELAKVRAEPSLFLQNLFFLLRLFPNPTASTCLFNPHHFLSGGSISGARGV